MNLLSITSGISSLASRISASSDEAARSVSRLASGNRFTRAADDVAGSAVATRMQSNITTLRSALINLAQAGSLLQVMDGALSQTSALVERMQSLSVMAASGTLTDAERGFLNQEFQHLREEIDRLLGGTSFNSTYPFEVHEEAVTVAPPAPSPITSLSQVAALEAGRYDVQADSQNFTGVVEEFDGASWLLIGRGRENWEFDDDGQGNVDDVAENLGSVAGFAPDAYSADIINDLLDNNSFDLNEIEIWIHRASDVTGTQYQDVLWRPQVATAWTWTFDTTNYAIEHEVRASNLGAAFLDTTSQTRDTMITPGTDSPNNFQRVWTFNWPGKANIPGFSYGASTVGVDGNSPTSFLWENTTENHATPYAEVYIRARTPDPNDTIVAGSGTSGGVMTIAEDAVAGDLVGTLEAEAEGERFYITGGDAAPFVLDAHSGELRVEGMSALDYETTTDYELEVSVYVGDELTDTRTIQVLVENVDESDRSITFVTGATSSQIISIDGEGLDSTVLFGNEPLDILSVASANQAQERMIGAQDLITSRRAEVGAKQSRVDKQTNAQTSSLQQLDGARAVIADTNIASTSTDYAQQLVQQQMGIAIMAQSNQLREDTVLGLLGAG